MNFMNNLVFMDFSYSRWNSLISFSTIEEHHEAFLRFYVTILFALLFNRKTLLSMVQWFVKISTQVPKRCQWNQSAGLVLWDPKDAAAQSRQVFLLPQLFQQPLLFPHRHWSCTMDHHGVSSTAKSVRSLCTWVSSSSLLLRSLCLPYLHGTYRLLWFTSFENSLFSAEVLHFMFVLGTYKSVEEWLCGPSMP